MLSKMLDAFYSHNISYVTRREQFNFETRYVCVLNVFSCLYYKREVFFNESLVPFTQFVMAVYLEYSSCFCTAVAIIYDFLPRIHQKYQLRDNYLFCAAICLRVFTLRDIIIQIVVFGRQL
jgi:hypothetical protein